jgi:hypothetical protein
MFVWGDRVSCTMVVCPGPKAASASAPVEDSPSARSLASAASHQSSSPHSQASRGSPRGGTSAAIGGGGATSGPSGSLLHIAPEDVVLWS